MSKYISFEASRISYTVMNDSFGILGESNFHDIMKMKNLRLNEKKSFLLLFIRIIHCVSKSISSYRNSFQKNHTFSLKKKKKEGIKNKIIEIQEIV